MDKTFFLSSMFVSTDQGNHNGETKCKKNCFKYAKLAFLHFRVRSYQHYLQKSYQRLLVSYSAQDRPERPDLNLDKCELGGVDGGGYCLREGMTRPAFEKTYCARPNEFVLHFTAFYNSYCTPQGVHQLTIA